MQPTILEQYVDRVYGYALRRTHSREEADELSQEILLTALCEFSKLRDPSRFEAWLWGIARNVTFSFRRSMGRARALYSYDIPEELPVEETDDDREALYDRLRTRLAMMSEIYRNILVLYYYDGLSIREISDRLHIPTGTISWRLAAGRQKLKKELTDMNETALHPVQMHLGIYGSGDYNGKSRPFPSTFIDDALSQNILYYAYEKPRTIEELASLSGVPAYFIEDNVRRLLRYEAMITQPGGRFRTDFLIFSDKHAIYCEEHGIEALLPVMDDILDALDHILHDAMEIDFYRAERSERALYDLFGVLAFSYESVHHCTLPYPPFARRYDGNEWRYIGNMETGHHRRIAIGLQHCANRGSRGNYAHKAFNGIRGIAWRSMMYDNYINVCADLLHDGHTEDVDSLACAIRDGYIEKRADGSLFVTTPAFTIEQTERFYRIVDQHLTPHIDRYAALVYRFVEGYKSLFPQHLAEDADRMCQNMFVSMYSVIAEYAQKTGRIATPATPHFCDVIQQFC